MSTALDLVNRMRAKRREASSTVLTDPSGIIYLECLNNAITTVLESRVWDFQKRSDGQITTVPPFTGSTLTTTPGSTAIFFSNYTGSTSTLYGQFVTRIIGLGDPVYGNTALRIDTASLIGTSAFAGLEDAWQGGVTFTGWKTLTYEYLLPETVREVLAVKQIETDEALIFSNSPEEFENAFPRPWDDFSNRPQVVCVGGEVKNTDLLAASSQSFGLALRVWPVPDAEYQLDYTYVRRQPRLTILTDILERVPPAVEDVIVDLGVARVILEAEKDIQTGLALEARVLKQVDALHRAHTPAAGRRPEMLSHDHTRTAPNSLRWLPRQVSGLTGS